MLVILILHIGTCTNNEFVAILSICDEYQQTTQKTVTIFSISYNISYIYIRRKHLKNSIVVGNEELQENPFILVVQVLKKDQTELYTTRSNEPDGC